LAATALMKKIFLTGASSGIGLAAARALVAAGHEVWGTSRDPGRIPNLARLHGVALDLADLNSVRESFGRALREAGRFDVVINNAGSGHFGPAESLSAEMIHAQFQTLLIAQIELCQLAMGAMKEEKAGLIINITSLASRLPVPFMSAYNAAKAAMASFIMTWQLEEPHIHIVDLQPADICTGFNDSILKTRTPDAQMAAAAARAWKKVDHNLQAAPKPDLVARAILNLIKHPRPPARITVGGTFQATIAPIIFRFLPQRTRIWGLKKYYGLTRY
jgi:NAD(P)-dependent dehydrogenase (short-subunit alcohol dehydrogenase family)